MLSVLVHIFTNSLLVLQMGDSMLYVLGKKYFPSELGHQDISSHYKKDDV